LIWIPGGTFRMGSDKHYPEEAPVHHVTVDGFWIDRTPVTNREFRTFVAATGHVTFAEIPPDPKDYPGALPHMLYAGSLVFSPPTRNVDLRDWSQWWAFLKGADWRHPYGPNSNINGFDDHPDVHVSFADALPANSSSRLAIACIPLLSLKTTQACCKVSTAFCWRTDSASRGLRRQNRFWTTSPDLRRSAFSLIFISVECLVSI
jgi:hypothetical protein